MNAIRQKILNLLPARIEDWSVAFSIWVILQLVYRYIYSLDFELTDFSNRAIGIVVLEGVDAGSRTGAYIKMIILTILLVLLLAVIVQKLVDLLLANQTAKNSHDKTRIFTLSAIGIFYLLISVLTENLELRIYDPIINFLITLSFLMLAAGRFSPAGRLLPDPDFFRLGWPLAIMMPLAVIFSTWVIKREKFIFTTSDFVIYFVLLAVTLMGLWLLVRLLSSKSIPSASIYKAIARAAVPVLLIPFSIPLSNELQYILAEYIYSARIVSAVVIGLLGLSAAGIFFANLRKPGEIRVEHLVTNLYFPIFIATLAIYFGHQDTHNVTQKIFYEELGQVQRLRIDHIDLFHQGEDLVVNQQLFAFGKIPFIDIYPTHGLSSVIPQILYSLFHGYKPIEVWLWNWILFVLNGILFYFLFKALFNTEIGFLAAVFLPYGTLFPNYYMVAILPMLVVSGVLAKPNPGYKHFAMLWAVCLGMVLWRIDFGIATIAAAVCLLIARYVHQFLCGETDRKELARFAIATGAALGVFFILFSLAAFLRGQSVIDLLVQNYLYITFQGAVQAFTSVFRNFDLRVFIQFLIVPGISIVYIVSFIIFYLVRRDRVEKKQWALVYIAIFSIIMSIRATQRHSLAVGYFSTYLAILLLGCLYLFIKPRELKGGLTLLLATTVVFCMLFPWINMSSFVSNPVKVAGDTGGAGLFTFRHWQEDEPRVIVTDTQVEPIKEFLNSHLEEGQTFYDLSSHSMLYVLLNREFATYFVPTVYNGSDQIQKIQLKNLQQMYAGQKLPYIIFKNGTRMDRLDSVPNELRVYRIVEFIYENYTPFRSVSGYQIWRAKNQPEKDGPSPGQMEVVYKPVVNTEGVISYRDATIEPDDDYIYTIHTGSSNPYIYKFIDKAPLYDLDPTKKWVLRVKCRSSVPGQIGVYFRFEGNGDFSTQNGDTAFLEVGNEERTLEFSILTTLGNVRIADIRIDPPKNAVFQFRDLEILSGSNTAVEGIAQNFTMMKLPYIWANYDPYDAASAMPVQAELLEKKVSLSAGEPITFDLPTELDKRTGNYVHFVIRSDEAGSGTLWYREKGNVDNLSSISFDIIPSDQAEEYLVRVSSQWAWMEQPNEILSVIADVPVEIEQITIRKGD